MGWYWIGLGALTAVAALISWTHRSTKNFSCEMARQVLLSTRETDYVVLSSRVEARIRGCPAEWVEREIRKALAGGEGK